MKTCIRQHHGAPTLFIDGRPDTGLMLYHNNVERGHDEMADFARAGIDLITTGVELDREQPTNWREQAQAAGVHLYTDAGDQVLAEKQLLTLHASSDGPRRIVLPRECRVTEAFTGRTVIERGTVFEVTLRQGETITGH